MGGATEDVIQQQNGGEMKKLWNNLKLMFSVGTKHYEISGYLHSGSAIVYEGHIPAVYNQEDEE